MKKNHCPIIVLSFILFISTTVLSQITISMSDYRYDDGEYYKMHSRDGSLWLVTGLTGLSGGPYTWDFTSGPTDKDYTFDYVLPSETPCNADFPLASISEQKTSTDGDPPAFMFLDFKVDTGRVNFGVCQPGVLDIPYIFNPPVVDLIDTINFMDNWTGATSFPAQSSGFDLDVDYDYNAFCNAYGTLTLPDGLGSFPCLQVNYLEHYKFFWDGILLQESYVRSYYWFIPNAGIAVIISSEEGTSPPPVDFDNSNVYSRMYESSKLSNSGFQLNLSILLEGPFNGLGMNTNLNNNNFLPLSQPYGPILPYYDNNSPVWYYTGPESVVSIPANVVDWVLVQVRDADSPQNATSATILGTQAAFLMFNGSIVALDGASNITFDVTVNQGLYAVVFQRNHLGVMSSSPLIEIAGTYSYDFRTSSDKVYGGANGYKELAPGKWGMVAGDGNGSGIIGNTDETSVWRIDLGSSGYYGGDYDMNAVVQNTDETELWKINLNSGGQVPVKGMDNAYKSQVPD